jgi:hypothetical protein
VFWRSGRQFTLTREALSSRRPVTSRFRVTPSEPVVSLDQLIRMARLIVDVDVSRLMPAIVRNAEMAGEVETDAMVTVREVLAGKAPGPGQILLVEDGGRQSTGAVRRTVYSFSRARYVNDHSKRGGRAAGPRDGATVLCPGASRGQGQGGLERPPSDRPRRGSVPDAVQRYGCGCRCCSPKPRLTREAFSRPKRPTTASSRSLKAWQSESEGDRMTARDEERCCEGRSPFA